VYVASEEGEIPDMIKFVRVNNRKILSLSPSNSSNLIIKCSLIDMIIYLLNIIN
jgi:hypothetical protein